MDQLTNALPVIKIGYNDKNVTIASKLRKRLKNHIATERILKYWSEHRKEFVLNDNFDQESFLHAGRNITQQHQLWLPKWSCGICGVGKWLERWKEQTHSKCPRCLQDNETVEHVVHCQHEDATLTWDQGIEKI